MFCGQPVETKTQADEALHTRLAASVPAPLAEKIRTAQLSGERKVITALFADVVGSTSMAERMDAEDWTEMMNGAFDRISQVIYRYEGSIARLLGDAVLAFFGAPLAHEDDPARALRASLEIIQVIWDYQPQVKRKFGVDFAVRVGVNTGSVVVGEIGSDLKYEYTAMGDAINLAARLQSAARPMSILTSQGTYRYISPLFEFNDLGQIEVKGKSESIQIYEVVGVKTQPGKLRGLAGLTSPMVGRQKELTQLVSLGRGLSEEHGGLAVIIGEAGLGKSRLLAEWHQSLTGTGLDFHWAEGHCLSYGQRLAYHLLIDLMRSLLGVHSAADESETLTALKTQTENLFGAATLEVFPYLAHLLSLSLDGEALQQVQALDPQMLQNQYRLAITRFLEELTKQAPYILILEDIHWADPASVDLLIQLMPLTVRAKLILCMVTRPAEETPGWRLVTSARESSKTLVELNLNPLTETDSRELVSNLLEIEALPSLVRDVILKKAEGNPFFVEEVIRMLIDNGAILQKGDHWEATREIEKVEIPDNLQGLLLARIDRLPEEAKRTLRVASVIGRQFSVSVLEQVLIKLKK
jgi:class 3 adenylate cyclase